MFEIIESDIRFVPGYGYSTVALSVFKTTH